MYFEHTEDIKTLKKISINVGALIGVMFFLILMSMLVGNA